MAEKLSEDQLSAIIAQQIELARNSDDKSDSGNTRAKQLDYFLGRMDAYVPPEPNRSKVVSRDVADVINWLMPEIIKIFTASRRMFVANPEEPEDLDYADEVTDGLNHVFWKENFGYGTVYDGTFDALLHGDGIAKTYYDDTPVYGPAKYQDGLSEDELAMLLQDEAVEVLAKTEHETEGYDMMSGETVMVKTYDIKFRKMKAAGRFVVTVIPRNEFLMDGEATNVEEAAFKDHWQRKTRSALVQMGYDKDEVWAIPVSARRESAEEQARRSFISGEANDESMELVDYHECFIMVDVDGDGVAELVRACYGGPGGSTTGSLLDWEVWEDEDPFDNIPCEPIPHRFGARSIADEEIDIQDVKTVLWRQLLNSTYWTTNPQRFAKGKILNPEQLDNPTFGGTVFGDANASVEPLANEYIGDKALAAINYADEVSARRTGINSQSMALDPEVLQNQSATANQNAVNASHLQPELIARNMAEYGWSKVGRKLLRLMHKHEEKPRTIMVAKKAMQIDARNWNPDMQVTINTGLGSGSRDKDAMMLGQVLQQQLLYIDRIAVAFPEKALEMLKYVHTTVTQFAESGGLRNPELYWPEINDQEIEAGKAALAERAKQPPEPVQLEQMKQQGAAALKDKDVQVAMQTAQIDAESDVIKNQAEMEADLATKEADRQNAIAIENAKIQGQIAIEQMRIASAERMKMIELEHQAKMSREQMANAQTLAAMKPQPEPAGKAN